MKERIMLDPAKVEAHSAKLMDSKPDHRSRTAHLIISSGLPSAIIEGVKHATAEEAEELADLLGCDLSDIVADFTRPDGSGTGHQTEAPTVTATPDNIAVSCGDELRKAQVCSRKGCTEPAMLGKKICEEHYATVMAGQSRKETIEEIPAAEYAAAYEAISGPVELPSVTIPKSLQSYVHHVKSQAIDAEPPMDESPAPTGREVRLMLELHKTLVGVLVAELQGSDKLDLMRITRRLDGLAEELAGVR